jgi:hypothetical protein
VLASEPDPLRHTCALTWHFTDIDVAFPVAHSGDPG